MYYILLEDKKKYNIGKGTDHSINNAYHFNEEEYQGCKQAAKNLNWTFFKVLDDGTRKEIR